MAHSAIPVKVLAIGEITDGTSQSGRQWYRRPFEIFDTVHQAAYGVEIYGEQDHLESFKEGGDYDAILELNRTSARPYYQIRDFQHRNKAQQKAS